MHKYKSFKIGGEDGIFNISTGRDIIIGRTKEGEIPLISHQHENNGISKYIEKLPNRRLFNHNDTIALADRGVFFATAQREDFYIGTRVKALTFKSGEKSERVRLFFVTAINKLQVMFEDYLMNATNKLPDLAIMLPVDENGQIDFGYMETYIQEIEETYIQELKEEYMQEQSDYLSVSGMENYILNDTEKMSLKKYRLGTIKYKSYKLGDGDERLFDITTPKKKFNANSIRFGGKYPYVVRSGNNNGIKGYITQDERYLNDGNTISFGQDTATIFYQEHPYFTGDKIKVMAYRDRKLTPEIACYLITLMRKAFQNFTWGQSSFNEKVLKNIEIELPVGETGGIDYDFITEFIKAQEKMAIEDMVNCNKKVVEMTKQCQNQSDKK